MAPAVTIDCAFDAGSLFDPADDCPASASWSAACSIAAPDARPADVDRRGARRSRRRPAGHDHPPRARGLLHLPGRGLSTTCWRSSLDVARDPAFPESEIEQARAPRPSPRCGRTTTTRRFGAVEPLVELLYGAGHPYGAPGQGHARVGRAHRARRPASRFTRARVRPSRLSLVIVGDVDAAHARDRAAARSSRTGQRRPPSTCPCRSAAAHAGRRSARIEMPGKSQADIAYGFTSDPPARSALLRLLDDEQRPGPVRPRRPARRQHPRAAGHGVLRLQRVRPEPRRRAARGPRRRRSRRTSSARSTAIDARGAGARPRRPDAGASWRRRAQYLIGSIPRMLETNDGIAAFLQTAEQFGLGLDYDRRLPGAAARRDARRGRTPRRASVLDPERGGGRRSPARPPS